MTTFTDFLEDTIMFSACFAKNLAIFLLFLAFFSYVLYYDGLFTFTIVFLGFLYLYLSYLFYIKNINKSRDILLAKLEKNGRKELEIEEDAKAINLFYKSSSCFLPKEPANAKEFTLTILYFGKEHLTIYESCPKSNIYKIHKKKANKKAKPKPVESCGESQEYYYSYIQSVEFKNKSDIIITINSGEKVVLKAAKAPGKKTVNELRKILRKTENNWAGHSRGSHHKFTSEDK